MARSPIADVVFPRRGRRAVVICGGPPPAPDQVAAWLADGDLLLCTDGAGRPYDRLPRLPDAVVGDGDSLPPGALPPAVRLLHDPDQETSDSEKALRHAAAAGCADAVLLGAVGGRFDHAWYNGDLLLRLRPLLPSALADPEGVTVALAAGESVAWDLAAGTLFSLLPQAGPSRVTAAGALYPLDDAVLAPGGLVSLSNRVTRPPLRLAVHDGGVLVRVSQPADTTAESATESAP